MRIPGRVWFIILILCAIAGGLGLWAGSVRVSESDVIEAGAALWQAETGGQRSACVGLPGARNSVWIEVRCRDEGASRVYRFDARGRRVEPDPGA